MSSPFRKGIDHAKEKTSSSFAPKFEKRFTLMKTEEKADLIICLKNINKVTMFFEHSYYNRKIRDNISPNLRVTCENYDYDPEGKNCELCIEQMFDKCIKKSKVVPIPVVDLRVFDFDDKRWGHTAKWWCHSSESIGVLESLIKSKRSDGECFGMKFTVRRIKKNAPRQGDVYEFRAQYDQKTMMEFFQKSPRTKWYVEQQANLGRKITVDTAIKEYFLDDDVEKHFSVDKKKTAFFMTYLQRIKNSQVVNELPTQDGWGTPFGDDSEDSTSYDGSSDAGGAFGSLDSDDSFDFGLQSVEEYDSATPSDEKSDDVKGDE